MKPGSLSSTGSALKQPFAAFFSIRNMQSLLYVFGGYAHRYWQSQRRFCDPKNALDLQQLQSIAMGRGTFLDYVKPEAQAVVDDLNELDNEEYEL